MRKIELGNNTSMIVIVIITCLALLDAFNLYKLANAIAAPLNGVTIGSPFTAYEGSNSYTCQIDKVESELELSCLKGD